MNMQVNCLRADLHMTSFWRKLIRYITLEVVVAQITVLWKINEWHL